MNRSPESRYFLMLGASVVVVTMGDFIVRQAALALLMGLFGFVCARIDPERERRSLAGIAAVGVNWVFAFYGGVQFVFLVREPPGAFDIALWVASVIIASLSIMQGAKIAARPQLD